MQCSAQPFFHKFVVPCPVYHQDISMVAEYAFLPTGQKVYRPFVDTPCDQSNGSFQCRACFHRIVQTAIDASVSKIEFPARL